MITPHVHHYCRKVWDAREAGALPEGTELARSLYLAVAADVLASPGYDPEVDHRVAWLRVIIEKRSAYRPHVRPEADEPQEDTIAWLIGRERPEREISGIERSAGEVDA